MARPIHSLATITKSHWRRLALEALEDRLAPAFAEFLDPNPVSGNAFGNQVVPLPNGNVVITSPNDDVGASNAGAVYLYNGSTGKLISALRGSSANDNVGSGTITVLTNGNFVVLSISWDNPATGAVNAGAVTFVNGTTGLNGVVSTANSLVGSSASDIIGSSGVTALANGHYVVRSSLWDNGPAAVDSGAITWGSGTKGVSGAVSSSNSLVSITGGSSVGNTAINELSNGHFVVRTPTWDNGAVLNVGAVTWANGNTGVSGIISAANSLIGSTSDDSIGKNFTALTNGNFVVHSTSWDNGGEADAGAVTFINGTTGRTGVVGPTNSLVGSKNGDSIGLSGIVLLANGNFLVRSPNWDNGIASSAGAVTFVNGLTGLVGPLSVANSLVGSSAGDNVGASLCIPLENDNYVVSSPSWDNTAPAAINAGAVTWGSGATGVSGTISAANSLIGDSLSDGVGFFVQALSNGNYVVASPQWNDANADVGAVTWGNGATGTVGVVSKTNSLVGSTATDTIGSAGVQVLPNGNYVVRSKLWDNGGLPDAGAVTWCNGATGLTVGAVSNVNSLVGSTKLDGLGTDPLTILTNGNYVIPSTLWDNIATNVGAVTWASGTAGIAGTITPANSHIGGTAEDAIGTEIVALANGNYVVQSPNWDNTGALNAGAVTWGNGLGGSAGQISAANSFVGTKASDQLSATITVLPNGNYVIVQPAWNNGAMTLAGAVTFANGGTGIVGSVTAANSLIGSASNDQVGNFTVAVLSNGNYVVRSPSWDNGGVMDAGAATWGSGATGVSGAITAANSLVGGTPGDSVGSTGLSILSNGHYVVRSANWDNGTVANAGAATWGDGASGISGTVSAANSLVGDHPGDNIGNNVTVLADGDYLVTSTLWNNGTHLDAGMMAWGSGAVGVRGVVSSANSLVGLAANTVLNAVPIVDNVNDAFYGHFTIEQFGGHVRVGSQNTGVIPTLSTVYVDDAFTGAAGTILADADPGTVGNQPATVGVNAFATIPLGLSQLISGGTLILNAGTYPDNVAMSREFTWKPTQGVATVSGVVSGPFGVVKEGSGTLVLAGANAFTGDVDVDHGTVHAGSDAAFGNASNAVTTGSLGVLIFTNLVTTSRTFDLGAGELRINGGVSLTLNAATLAGGTIRGPGILSFSGGASLLQGVELGTSLISDVNASPNFNNVTNRGTLTVEGGGKTLNASEFMNTTSGIVTLHGVANVDGFTSDGRMTINGTLTNSTLPALLGGGSVTSVSATATFNVGSPGARVAGGLVKNAGSFSGAGTITVDFNGRVQGAGTFGSVVTINGGVFAPGASPGAATTHQYNLNGGGCLEFEVSNASGTPGVVSGWDLVNVQPTIFSPTGLMNYTSTPTDKYIVQLKSRLDDGIGNTPGTIANFNSALPYAWKFADGSNPLTGNSSTFDANTFQIDTTGFSNSFTGGFGVELRDGGKNLYVVYTPVAGPIVTGFVVNNGNEQRSRLTTIQVNFAAPVDAATLQPIGAITLTRTAATVSGTVGTIVNISSGLIVSPASGMVSSVTLNFSNINTTGVNFGSLADGRWRLAIPSLGFQSPLNDPTLRRLYGDDNADGTVDGNDLAAFGALFGSTGPSTIAFDFNADGTVDALDFGEFGGRFGDTL